jgi:mycothiol synthase
VITPRAAIRPFVPDDLPGIRAVMEASRRVDDVPGLNTSEIERRMILVAAEPDMTLVALDDGELVGYCSTATDDLTVHPDHRRRGHGHRLVDATRALLADRGQAELILYVPSHMPGSLAFVRELGFRYRSSLWQFELDEPAAVPRPVFPADVSTRTWYPDEDVEAWVTFVARAFEGHPTPVHVTPDVVRLVNADPRFDPGGILMVERRDEPGVPIAFARAELLSDGSDVPGGYVNLIGVLPAWRGRGLGRELLRWAVAYLRERGAARISLAVEAANDHATELYRRHAFRPTIEWPQRTRPTT